MSKNDLTTQKINIINIKMSNLVLDGIEAIMQNGMTSILRHKLI